MRRILSIDGGGIKGVYPASILAEFDQHCERGIREYFDLIVGTSTGGILAIGLGLGRSPEQLLGFYKNDGPKIFGQGRGNLIDLFSGACRTVRRLTLGAKYQNSALRKALDMELGTAKLGDSANRLVIPSFAYETAEIRMDKTAHHRNLVTDYKKDAVEVAMSTAAAPTFFKPFRGADGLSLIDGGVWANNPVSVAAREAVHYLGWGDEEIRILSLGCTSEPVRPAAHSSAIGMMAKKWVVEMFMSAQSSEALKSARVITQKDENRRTIWRLDDIVSRNRFALDRTKSIQDLEGLGRAKARQEYRSVVDAFLVDPAEPFIPFKKVVV